MQSYKAVRASICVFAALLLIGAAPEAEAQAGPDLRTTGKKMDLSQLRALPQTNQVVVKFREGEKVRLTGQRLTGMRSGQANLLNNVLSQAGVSQAAMKPLHVAPPEELERERDTAQRRSGRQLADLSLYFVIDLPPTVSAAEVANNLNGLAFVEYAAPALKPAPPPIYVIPKAADPLPEGDAARRAGSPNFAPLQTYKGNGPRGIGPIPSIKGNDGKGMSFADVEYDWALAHEDLRLPYMRNLETLTPDKFGGPDHGTAVLGILSGVPNNFGVTGIVPAAFAYVAAASTSEMGYLPARAIGIAMNKLKPGDVILIEQQSSVCGLEDYGPLEFYQDVFDAVSAATAKGIIVVAAAGNGDVNLDRETCLGAFDRSKRDSQAIIVGAGSSIDHARLSFSSYGSRVDVQGWGENVTTTGYGDAFNPTNDVRRYYTKSFNGTSSATPIVSGAVLVIQGVRKACGLPPATPLEMRDLLERTGVRQGSPRARHIGPLPNIEAALKASVPATCLNSRNQVQPVSDATQP
jgi:serine protease